VQYSCSFCAQTTQVQVNCFFKLKRRTTGARTGGLKLQCIVIATFSSLCFSSFFTSMLTVCCLLIRFPAEVSSRCNNILGAGNCWSASCGSQLSHSCLLPVLYFLFPFCFPCDAECHPLPGLICSKFFPGLFVGDMGRSPSRQLAAEVKNFIIVVFQNARSYENEFW